MYVVKGLLFYFFWRYPSQILACPIYTTQLWSQDFPAGCRGFCWLCYFQVLRLSWLPEVFFLGRSLFFLMSSQLECLLLYFLLSISQLCSRNLLKSLFNRWFSSFFFFFYFLQVHPWLLKLLCYHCNGFLGEDKCVYIVFHLNQKSLLGFHKKSLSTSVSMSLSLRVIIFHLDISNDWQQYSQTELDRTQCLHSTMSNVRVNSSWSLCRGS